VTTSLISAAAAVATILYCAVWLYDRFRPETLGILRQLSWERLVIAVAAVTTIGYNAMSLWDRFAGPVSTSQVGARTANNIHWRFDQVPPHGKGPDQIKPISGRVEGISNPSEYKVVLYSFADRWFVQPSDTAPYTMINNDGTWSNRIHLGSRYAALLVNKSFTPPAQADALPDGADVLASNVVEPLARANAPPMDLAGLAWSMIILVASLVTVADVSVRWIRSRTPQAQKGGAE